jgi:hypothetical protein
MPTIDHAQQLLNLQAAMRALWPDRKVVYFTEASANSQGPGVVLTRDEQDQLTRVAQAIGTAQNSAEIEEGAIYDFLQWLAPQQLVICAEAHARGWEKPSGELLERWKAERDL